MLDRRVVELEALMEDGYTLTHMTGYRQLKREWLEAIASGQMRYHAAEEKSVEVKVTGDYAVLVGRGECSKWRTVAHLGAATQGTA